MLTVIALFVLCGLPGVSIIALVVFARYHDRKRQAPNIAWEIEEAATADWSTPYKWYVEEGWKP